MGSLSSFNCGVKYLLCVIYDFMKHVWVKILKDKKAETVLHGFIEIVNKSNHPPTKLWVDEGREFYNNLIKNVGRLWYFNVLHS